MKRVEKAWGRGNTAAVLLMDVKGAFPHVAKGNLRKKMVETGLEADLVRWVENCMEERKVIMSMDGKEGESMEVETVWRKSRIKRSHCSFRRKLRKWRFRFDERREGVAAAR